MTKKNDSPDKPANSLFKKLLAVGSAIGAIGAIVSLPGVVYAVWKNSNELIDSWTEPDVVATATRFTIRCAYRKPISDRTPLNLADCENEPLAASVMLTFSNLDFIPRSISGISAILQFEGRQKQKYALGWPRSVSHQIINGRDSVVWTAWPSIEVGARESFRQEIMFTGRNEQPRYKPFLRQMYGGGVPATFDRASMKVIARFVGEEGEIEILHCSSSIPNEYIQKRIDNPSKQNQLTLGCSGRRR